MLLSQPAQVKRTNVCDAVDVIHGRAAEPLTVSAVARGVGVSVRALQAGFRRELGTTPKQYLQKVRLERAHEDLVRGEPRDGTTVVDVAIRWGFLHAGRFAAAHLRTYGEAPSVTLRTAPRPRVHDVGA
ncbi:helix-turn-helix transcriptional regulator [Pseudonocardia sp. H11422]|uniref:helix-turn-helix transcriptional regulator n=1 Tax=Pseudonocardia sp. H11422 TaxID=2835866 RepID=UPI001BDC846E|nr:helix-turn-helix transcriptional regulator [Pseudonocardia sp. H11422]